MCDVMLTPCSTETLPPPQLVHDIRHRKELVEVHTDRTTGLSEHVNMLYAAGCMHHGVHNRLTYDDVLRS